MRYAGNNCLVKAKLDVRVGITHWGEMLTDAQEPPVKPEATPEVRAYMRALGRYSRGFGNRSSEMMSVIATLTNPRKWLVRRQRYGPSGRRDKRYVTWLKEHGKSLPSEKMLVSTLAFLGVASKLYFN